MPPYQSAARRAIDLFPPTDENYPRVVDILKRKFGDERSLVESLQAELLHLPKPGESVQSLRNFAEAIERICLQLTDFGEDEQNRFMASTIKSNGTQLVHRELVYPQLVHLPQLVHFPDSFTFTRLSGEREGPWRSVWVLRREKRDANRAERISTPFWVAEWKTGDPLASQVERELSLIRDEPEMLIGARHFWKYIQGKSEVDPGSPLQSEHDPDSGELGGSLWTTHLQPNIQLMFDVFPRFSASTSEIWPVRTQPLPPEAHCHPPKKAAPPTLRRILPSLREHTHRLLPAESGQTPGGPAAPPPFCRSGGREKDPRTDKRGREDLTKKPRGCFGTSGTAYRAVAEGVVELPRRMNGMVDGQVCAEFAEDGREGKGI
uniref:Uncharacterized protein n=1 Tax=Globodera rostochiensis TaxID=31243 RepID=A0A914GZJ3_GLORO